MNDSNTFISEIKSKAIPILSAYKVVQAGIFGSVARGEASEGSDVDFLVRFADDSHISLFELAGLRQDLETVLNREIDLVEYDQVKEKLKKYIYPEEIRIYEKR